MLEQERKKNAQLAEGFRVKALIADDNRVNRDVLSQLLVHLGVEVRQAEDGSQAVERVKRYRPDIVFMDIRMPVMGGLQAAQAIWGEVGTENIKIVAISASTLAHEQQAYFDAGFDDFISKPFRLGRVCQSLADLLGVEFESAESQPDTQESEDGSASTDFVIPPSEVLEALYELVRAGDRRGILSFVDAQSEASTDDGKPFFAQIASLAKAYQIRQIRDLIEPHLEIPTPEDDPTQ